MTSDRAAFIPGPGPDYVPPKLPPPRPPAPSRPDDRADFVKLARAGLAEVGRRCACGCGPLVHSHDGQTVKHCAFCGVEVCAVYRPGARPARSQGGSAASGPDPP